MRCQPHFLSLSLAHHQSRAGLLSSPPTPQFLHVWVQKLCSPSNQTTSSQCVSFFCHHGNSSKPNQAHSFSPSTTSVSFIKKRERESGRWEMRQGQCKRAIRAEARRTKSAKSQGDDEKHWGNTGQVRKPEREKEMQGGKKQFIENKPALVLWSPTTYSALCSVGTSCLPGLDLRACRKIHLAAPPYPRGCAVTAGPDLPVDWEGGQGTKPVSESVCRASATVNTSWAAEHSAKETQWWKWDSYGAAD